MGIFPIFEWCSCRGFLYVSSKRGETWVEHTLLNVKADFYPTIEFVRHGI
jgi:hypothetical protein